LPGYTFQVSSFSITSLLSIPWGFYALPCITMVFSSGFADGFSTESSVADFGEQPNQSDNTTD
jgi:hypothetical protein